MGEFIYQIVKHTPIWVWGILIALIALGVQQMRSRSVKPFVVLIAPLVFLAIGVLTAGRTMIGFTVWAVALASISALTVFLLRPVGRARFDASMGRLLLPGSVIPLCIMMGMFSLNYAIAVINAMHPEYRAQLAWQIVPALMLGALSGFFIGRAATLFRLKSSTTK